MLGCVAFVSRVLVDLKSEFFAISQKAYVVRLRVTIPFEEIFVLRGRWISDGGEGAHHFGERTGIRGVSGRGVKFTDTVFKPDRHPAALGTIKTDFEFPRHKLIMVAFL